MSCPVTCSWQMSNWWHLPNRSPHTLKHQHCLLSLCPGSPVSSLSSQDLHPLPWCRILVFSNDGSQSDSLNTHLFSKFKQRDTPKRAWRALPWVGNCPRGSALQMLKTVLGVFVRWVVCSWGTVVFFPPKPRRMRYPFRVFLPIIL